MKCRECKPRNTCLLWCWVLVAFCYLLWQPFVAYRDVIELFNMSLSSHSALERTLNKIFHNSLRYCFSRLSVIFWRRFCGALDFSSIDSCDILDLTSFYLTHRICFSCRDQIGAVFMHPFPVRLLCRLRWIWVFPFQLLWICFDRHSSCRYNNTLSTEESYYQHLRHLITCHA